MKSRVSKLVQLVILLMVVSCNEPETTVTDIVHTDGSVTRIVEMKSTESDSLKRFKSSNIQVPVDASWSIRDSVVFNKKGDTTWLRRAEKLFKNADEINLAYKSDSGVNRKFSRQANFKKSFRWFNTEYRFSERIERNLSFGYPVDKFLNNEELKFFYSPDGLRDHLLKSPDSTKYKVLNDSVKAKTDSWQFHSIISEWIGIFSEMTGGTAGADMTSEVMKSRESAVVSAIEANPQKADSLWTSGVLLQKLIGETNALKFKVQADTALSMVTRKLTMDFRDYSVKINMPGKLIGTNGFLDSSRVLLWPVKSDFFFTEPYEMWAESKTTNTWAWIVSGIFVAFVLTGIILRSIKKG